MHDNATALCPRVVFQFLNEQGVDCMDWPTRSPDMNPLEHARDMLQLRVSARPGKPSTRQEVAAALVEECNLIPQDIRKLTRRFPSRVREVIRARGGHSHY